MKLILLLIVSVLSSCYGAKSVKFSESESMPAPFYRELSYTDPNMVGDDVTIAQSLLKRDDSVDSNLEADGVYGQQTEKATMNFQTAVGLEATGTLDEKTAELLLELHTDDGVTDTGFTAESMGYLYKFHIPVYKNRSVETIGTLYDAKNNVLLKFKVRAHGHRDDGSDTAWPDYGDGDVGLTELASNGNTLTGLVEMDLNSPEPNPDLYGPWPINRVVRGLEGNAEFMLPYIRDGILLHTGNWTTDEVQWDPTKDMPNSSGCMHAHPTDVYDIYQTLVGLGVQVNENPFSGKEYPFKPQGVGVIELMD